jgi:hypothetical protein
LAALERSGESEWRLVRGETEGDFDPEAFDPEEYNRRLASGITIYG